MKELGPKTLIPLSALGVTASFVWSAAMLSARVDASIAKTAELERRQAQFEQDQRSYNENMQAVRLSLAVIQERVESFNRKLSRGR